MSKRGWVLFAAMSLIWGIPYLMIKVAVEEVSVPVLVFARTAIGAAVLLPLALRSTELSALRRHWLPLVAFASIEMIIPWGLLSDAERHLSSSMTGLLIAASPIAAVLIALATGDRERLGLKRWSGLFLGLAGVALLAAPELEGGAPWPIVEVLLTAVCYATAPLIAARRLQDLSSLTVSSFSLGLASLVYAPPAILTWPDQMPSGQVLAALAGLALICTALAFVVFFALIQEVGPARALVFTYINPAVAVLAGVLLLDEELTLTVVLSFALILGGSVLATASQPKSADPSAAAADTDRARDAEPEPCTTPNG